MLVSLEKMLKMSKRESLLRYSIVIRTLRQAPTDFDSISEVLSKESELQQYDLTVSKRTFQRDLDDIRSLYNVDIVYDFSSRLYRIEGDHDPGLSRRILEAFDIMNAFRISGELTAIVGFERRSRAGTEYLFELLQAVKRRQLVTFTYSSYQAGEASDRKVEPYGLKEFRNRWYLVARDQNDGLIKCFALDRLTGLIVSDTKFDMPAGFSIENYFRDCFGIIRPRDEEPQEVELTFDPHQGKYIKSLPLHNSQVIISDSDTELRVWLKLFITHDFVMELLSFGDTVKVVKPLSLADELLNAYKNAISQY